MNPSEVTAVQAAIKKWSGCWAEPWDYTTSHDWLRIKLQRRGQDFSCAILLMVDCTRVAFLSSWEGFSPTITEYSDAYGKRYLVTDGDRLDVDCGGLYVSRTLASYTDIPKLHDHLFGRAVI